MTLSLNYVPTTSFLFNLVYTGSTFEFFTVLAFLWAISETICAPL